MDIVFFGGRGHRTRVLLGKGACYWALVGVLIISELLAGAYSLSIAGYYLGRVALIRGHITWVLLWEHIIGVM